MHETRYFIPIVILLGISLGISFIVSLFKFRLLPTFVFEIIVGIALGPVLIKYFNGNGFSDITDFLYVIGFSLIMFLSGYDIHLHVFSKKHVTCSYLDIGKVSFILLGTIYLASIVASIAFIGDFNKILPGIILLTITLSSTFAGVVVPLIHVEHLHGSTWGKIIITFSFLSELISVVLLTIFMIVYKVTISNYWSFLAIFGVFLIVYLLLKIRRGARIEGGMVFFSTKLMLVALFACVIFSELGGGEYVLGAFLLGFLLRILDFSEKKMRNIEAIGFGLFIPMFFVIVGINIDIMTFINNPELLLTVLFIFIAFMVTKLPIFILSRWYQKKTVITSWFLIASTLVVAITAKHIGHEMHIFSEEFGEALVFASVLTMIVGPLVFEINCFGPLRNIRTEEKEISHAKN